MRLLNGLSGRAWRLAHKRPDLTVQGLAAAAAADVQIAMEKTIAIIRTACEKAAPLRKREAFDNYVRKGVRRATEQSSITLAALRRSTSGCAR